MGKRVVLAALAALFLLPTVAVGSGPPPTPGPGDRCPVCGMFVAPHQAWVAVAAMADDTFRYFDGPKDMFKFRSDPRSYLQKSDTMEVTSLWVVDYYGLEMVEASKAWFVVGSKVFGPMGNELVPLVSEEDAKAFAGDHGGKICTFGQVDEALLSEIP